MYVDESGDSGNNVVLSRYFALSGLVVHEAEWQTCLKAMIAFRRQIKSKYGLRLREEIHAYAFISKASPELLRIPRQDRLAIIREFIDLIETLPLSIVNVIVDKQGKGPTYDVFGSAWQALVQRLENTITHKNFPGPGHGFDFGLVLPDDTNRKKLTALIRKMRHYNPVPNTRAIFGTGYRNLQLQWIIEDPFYKDSLFSYFTQAADCVAYMLYQKYKPNRYIQRKTGQGYFGRLNNALCKVANANHLLGIVEL